LQFKFYLEGSLGTASSSCDASHVGVSTRETNFTDSSIALVLWQLR
jgi:hypothetical protein